MKVLSVRQPYAAMIVLGLKRYEARTWDTDYRGELWIHAASAAITRDDIRDLEYSPEVVDALRGVGITTVDAVKALPRSAIIGRVQLTDIMQAPDCDDFSELDADLCGPTPKGIHLWHLRDPQPIDPWPVPGKLKLWELPADGRVEVVRSLAAPPDVPSWTRARSDGSPLEVTTCTPSPDMQRIVGEGPMSRKAANRSWFAYAASHDLLLPAGGLRLTPEVAFLSPGKKRLSLEAAADAVLAHLG